MNNTLVVGPFVLPYSLLLAFASVASTLYAGKRSGRKAGIDVESVLWHALLVGLVVARLAFVWEFRSAYWASPLDVLDIRDGGWSPTAGFVGAWLFALSRPGQLPAAKKALRAALLTGHRSLGRRCCRAVGETRYRAGTAGARLHVARGSTGDARGVQRQADRRQQTSGCCVQARRAAHDAVLRRQRTAGEHANRRAVGRHSEREAASPDRVTLSSESELWPDCAMGLTAWFVILPLSLVALTTGLVQVLGTAWGLFPHYWIPFLNCCLLPSPPRSCC